VLDGGADADYYQVLYKLNGGALTTFATNGYIQGNGGAPFSVSGNTLTANLTGMCLTCNQTKGPTILDEFKQLNNKEKVQNIEVTLSWILPLIYAMCIITAVHLILTALLLYAQSR
jgi:hypothetical protein